MFCRGSFIFQDDGHVLVPLHPQIHMGDCQIYAERSLGERLFFRLCLE